MNQNWAVDNVLLFSSKGGKWELYTYKVRLYFYTNYLKKGRITYITYSQQLREALELENTNAMKRTQEI